MKGPSFATGKNNQAFNLDGFDDAVAIAVQPNLSTALTISVWVNFESHRFGTTQEIFNNNQFFLRKNEDSGANRIAFFVKLKDGSIEPRAQSTTIPVPGAWYHVAATWDGTTSRIYVNGVAEGSSLRRGTLTSKSVGPIIGAGEQTALHGNGFTGRIDELAMFNRALSASEIKGIFNAGVFGMAKPVRTQTPTTSSSAEALTWFAPNMGSLDFSALFDSNDQWTEARTKTNIFKFYTQNVIPGPCEICGKNTLATFRNFQAFRQLTD